MAGVDERFPEVMTADEAPDGVSSSTAYVFEPYIVIRICEAIDSCCSGPNAYLGTLAAAALDRAGITLDEPVGRELYALFNHHIRIAMSDSSRTGADLFAVDSNDHTEGYPVPIRSASPESVELWRTICDTVTHPLAAGFLHDVLFSRRDGNVGLHAKTAVAKYLEFSSTPNASMFSRCECSLRAWTISKVAKLNGELDATRVSLAELVRSHLASEKHDSPGLVLPALAALVDGPKIEGHIQLEIDTLLADALVAYGTADHIDYLAKLLHHWSKDTYPLHELNRRRVQARIARAEDADEPFMKSYWYEAAIKLGNHLDVSDLSRSATQSLQSVDLSDADWVHFRMDLTPRPEYVAAFSREFLRDNDWQTALIRWLYTSPPSGNYEGNVRSTEKSIGANPLSCIIPSRTVGIHGLPQHSSNKAGYDVPDGDVRRTEYYNAAANGYLLSDVLDEIGASSNGADSAIIAEVITSAFKCDLKDSYILARALRLYWQEDYLEAVHLVTPFAEGGARKLLLLLNEPLYRVEEAKKIGQFPGLGALLPLLRDNGLDNDWVRFLQTLLLPEGQNYRNQVAHGFTYSIDRVNAALIIRAASLLMLMPTLPTTQNSRSGAEPVIAKRSLRSRLRSAAMAARWGFNF